MPLTLVRLSFLYLLIGARLGVVMGATGNFALRAVLVVDGVLVKLYPALEESKLTRAWFWIYNLALLVSLVALTGMLRGANVVLLKPLAIAGATLSITAAALLFAASLQLKVAQA